MSRIPPGLASRIDRLARRAHGFHRFAHHPLCGAYATEVVRLGRQTRLCRGCALAAAGAALGALAGRATPHIPVELALLGPALLVGWGAVAVAPRRGHGGSRWATRAGPMALAAFLVVAGLRSAFRAQAGDWSGAVAAATATLLVGLGLLRYRARGPDRTACTTCPQAPPGPGCDGFRPVARRERAFSRLAARWIALDRRRATPCDTPGS